MGIQFEWDAEKARSNEKKHGISFGEAATVFADWLSLAVADPLHSEGEDRFVIIGQSHVSRLLVVVFAERGDRIRIISARRATSHEREQYDKESAD